MKLLIISQVFWPDNVSTSQHLSDLAEEFVSEGHEVHVLCSRFAYENPKISYPAKELHAGISIERLHNSRFGKKNHFLRGIDFFSFNTLLFFRLLRLKSRQYDMIVGMTSPPFVSFIGSIISKRKKIKFSYWAMDLQPELAIASGLIKEKSFTAKLFTRIGNYIIRRADTIIALDKYMQKYFVKRGAREDRIAVIPVWPVVENKYNGPRENNPYRLQHKFGERIVVMYSGNHAYVHPLNTLLETVLQLKDDNRFLFVFVGEGVRKKEVTAFKQLHQLDSIIQLPYEPRNNIHNSLGSADLQVVILGDGQVGFTHPNKIYAAMFLGKPILYIGPEKSHIVDILDNCPGNISVKHGESQRLAEELKKFARKNFSMNEQVGKDNLKFAEVNFDPGILRRKTAEAMLK